jgi:hypothetical protein
MYSKSKMLSLMQLLSVSAVSAVALHLLGQPAIGQSGPSITVPSTPPAPPSELNPTGGGAPMATPEQASAFAWQEFIALNWPAGPQQGQPNQRDTPSSSCRFGDPSPNCNVLVWETFRHKVEIFPGDFNPPPGYTGSSSATSWGYDALPAYHYAQPVAACDSNQAADRAPWINLDETDQITLDNMYAGVVEPNSSPGNSAPQLIRFLAKANRTQYVYVAGNTAATPSQPWWQNIPTDVVARTKAYLAQYQASPPPNSTMMVSLPNGTIEMKAGWRPLNPSEIASGRFHTQMVRFYGGSSAQPCYHDAIWGLVALHIIQKTPSAPYFIYATFEQADNILTPEGSPVEDADGVIIAQPEPVAATTPQVCLYDPRPNPPGTLPDTSISGRVFRTADPTNCPIASQVAMPPYCDLPGNRLYYYNASNQQQPAEGNICVNKRDNAIPDYVVSANKQAHAAISAYLQQNRISSAPWLSYKLVNVQYYPYDKIPNPNIPNGSPYTARPPYTAANPAPSSYYQANIVVETNRSLQLFAGGLSQGGRGISTEWNQDATMHKNTYYGGHFYNMGGCMGCHGSQGQNPAGLAGDFSVILARGAVLFPEVPAPVTSKGLTAVRRNR